MPCPYQSLIFSHASPLSFLQTVMRGFPYIAGGHEIMRCDVVVVGALESPASRLMGGHRGGYIGGLTQAVVTGMLAGENAASPTESVCAK
jgi:hypothetical protein